MKFMRDTTMPITIEWDNSEHTVIFRKFIGSWTWDEYSVAEQTLHQMLATVPHRVDVITDLRQSTITMPEGAIARTRQIVKNLSPNRGITVDIGASALVRMFMPVFARHNATLPAIPETVFVETLDEARAYLQEQRARSSS
jgi:hypothetical protein